MRNGSIVMEALLPGWGQFVPSGLKAIARPMFSNSITLGISNGYRSADANSVIKRCHPFQRLIFKRLQTHIQIVS
jgi:hypothetical protein